MRATKERKVPCAACRKVKLDPVDGHACGWRPLCESCYKKERGWWFDELGFCGPISNRTAMVRSPNENFGRSPGSN